MRNLPAELQEALECGVTTLARCWRVERADGVVFGFTDHDRPLTFDGTVFEPESGFAPSAIEAGTGLSADTQSVGGALQSERITPEDIGRGVYSGAEVRAFLVDWTNPETRILLSRGAIGEIRRGEIAFEAEVVGLADQLNQPTGRAYLSSCECRLGDSKCGVDIADPAFGGLGTVTGTNDPRQLLVSGLDGFEPNWFTNGALTWTSGANTGANAHVKAHLSIGADTLIELWLAPPAPIEPGDTFEITAGCDKTSATCAAKFGNIAAFRGFPHIPGDDVASSYPSTGGTHDGGSLFR